MGTHPRFGSFMPLADDAGQVGDGQPIPPAPPAPPGQAQPGPPTQPAQRAVRFRGHVVGHVDRDGFFVRRVHDRHVLRNPPSIALHVDVLATLATMSVVGVAFTLDDGTVLVGPLSLYTGERGIDVDRGGYGPQRAVLLTDFFGVEVRRATADDVDAFVEAARR